MKYKTKGCINILGKAFKDCLVKTTDREVIDERLDYIKNNPAFFLWCSVTEQDPERLSMFTRIRNHSFLKKICQEK